ncbi:hypothetical protein AAFJ72_21295 [Brevibacillus gelatini]|mgnify:CR=1 FL=1|uniref:hypothetical protein n=1 Tax=Brevibacillus gelatini TaxID=1655277 RepID=UPI003D815137
MVKSPYIFICRETAFIPSDIYPHEVVQEKRRAEQQFLSKLAKILDDYLKNNRDPPDCNDAETQE